MPQVSAAKSSKSQPAVTQEASADSAPTEMLEQKQHILHRAAELQLDVREFAGEPSLQSCFRQALREVCPDWPEESWLPVCSLWWLILKQPQEQLDSCDAACFPHHHRDSFTHYLSDPAVGRSDNSRQMVEIIRQMAATEAYGFYIGDYHLDLLQYSHFLGQMGARVSDEYIGLVTIDNLQDIAGSFRSALKNHERAGLYLSLLVHQQLYEVCALYFDPCSVSLFIPAHGVEVEFAEPEALQAWVKEYLGTLTQQLTEKYGQQNVMLDARGICYISQPSKFTDVALRAFDQDDDQWLARQIYQKSCANFRGRLQVPFAQCLLDSIVSEQIGSSSVFNLYDPFPAAKEQPEYRGLCWSMALLWTVFKAGKGELLSSGQSNFWDYLLEDSGAPGAQTGAEAVPQWPWRAKDSIWAHYNRLLIYSVSR
ncbi:MAG: hypothetical protein ACRC5A_09340 [Enterobacteriaceae bacterium]